MPLYLLQSHIRPLTLAWASAAASSSSSSLEMKLGAFTSQYRIRSSAELIKSFQQPFTRLHLSLSLSLSLLWLFSSTFLVGSLARSLCCVNFTKGHRLSCQPPPFSPVITTHPLQLTPMVKGKERQMDGEIDSSGSSTLKTKLQSLKENARRRYHALCIK